MDAKARDLTLLAALSLFCAMVTWAGDRDILGSAFLRWVWPRFGAQLCYGGDDTE
jgi:hypothetical protein